MRRASIALLLLAALLPFPVNAQVTARQGAPKESAPPDAIEIGSPMVVDVDVPAWRANVRDQATAWATTQTAKFVCDKARVSRLEVKRFPKPLGGETGTAAVRWARSAAMQLVIAPTLSTDWFRQDIDLTITLSEADGTEVASKSWDDLTIGEDSAASMMVWASSSKTPKLILGLTEEMVDRFERTKLHVTRTAARLSTRVRQGPTLQRSSS